MNHQLQLFVGEASDAEARIYAALDRAGLPDHAQLVGELVGPYCRYSRTLPARIRFVDRGPGATLLAEAVVPDPCFWTPELPFMYSAELRVNRADNSTNAAVPALVQRPFGIRRLVVQGRSIYLDAKRFVIRGVRHNAPTIEEIRAARKAASALYIDVANDQLLQEASEEGVLLVVRLPNTKTRDSLIRELARLGRWPAAAVAVLDTDLPAGKELRLAARNMLLAQRFSGEEISTAPLGDWAQLVWWELETGHTPIPHPPHHVPAIVFRPDSANAVIGERRHYCDQLQADLSPLADFAGYFV